jgi:hypothetical protein
MEQVKIGIMNKEINAENNAKPFAASTSERPTLG